MWRVGITGGIGSGKSTAAALMRQMGADVIDADALARQCTEAGGRAIPSIRDRFGAEMITTEGAMDRQRMRDLVFREPAAKLALEAIVHPVVGLAIQEATAQSHSPCLVFDIPLLVESPRWRPQLDRVVVVDCTEDTQVRRVQARNALAADMIKRIIAQQASRPQRLQAADLVIYNDSDDLDALKAEVARLAGRFGL
jgi:dephospho-CoA kinase